MGRAIDQDNRLDDHERRLKLVEDALEEMIQTRVHHVDLHNDLHTDKDDRMAEHERKVREENKTVEPDETFTAPKTESKKTKSKKPKRVESLL
tara:strand:- start:404 stop:682 length:279 start_codon:yes stop_codon:yes gene_type:complete